MNKIRIEDVMDINMLLALTKCMTEVAHNLKYIHVQSEKQRLKSVINATKMYEKELEKRFNSSQKDAVEDIYDVIMDLILDARQTSLDNYKKSEL